MAKLKKTILLLLVIAMVVVGGMFLLLNEATVQLDLIFYLTPPLPVSALVLLTFIIGVLLGMVIMSLTVLKVKVKSGRPGKKQSGQALATNS